MKLLSLFLALVIAAGCSNAGDSESTIDIETPAATAETTPPTEETQPEASIPDDWETYTDTIVGFTFRYPPDWFILGNGTADALIYAITLQDAPFAEEGSGGLPDDITKIDIVVDHSAVYGSLDAARDAWFSMQGEGQGSSEVVDETRRTLPDGREVITVTTAGTPIGETITVIMRVNEHRVTGTILHGDAETLLQILGTLQPT